MKLRPGISVAVPHQSALRNMAAIFVNLAGLREAVSGHVHFVPPETAAAMQKHYMLYRAAYNCFEARTS